MMKEITTSINKIVFFILLGGSVFFTSNSITDTLVMSKWLWTGVLVGILGFVVSIELLLGRLKCEYSAIFKMIAFFCICQALYGVLKYFEAIPSAYYSEFVIGSFDNTAGFVSCICFGFPFILYYLRKDDFKIKIISVISCLIVFVTVLLSLSRCGILCVVLTLFIYIYKVSNKRCFLWIGLIVFAIVIITSFCIKKDSISGRFLIWRCSLEMIKDNPIKGQGKGAFAAHYMDYQANFFQTHPNSKYLKLADNVRHPFNEYMYITIQYGILVFIIIIIFALFLFMCYWKYPSDETFACLLSLLCVSFFSCFSYPFRYPFTWIILCICIGKLIKSAYGCKLSILLFNRMFGGILLGCSILFIAKNVQIIRAEIQWKMVDNSIIDKKEKMLNYNLLFSQLRYNPFFLYNYAATLYKYGENEKALMVANYCRKYFLADYDLELLRADLYKLDHAYQDAIACLEQAAYMCPSKFVPLYKLYVIYNEMGALIRRDSIAYVIQHKEVKVASPIIDEIKKKIKEE